MIESDVFKYLMDQFGNVDFIDFDKSSLGRIRHNDRSKYCLRLVLTEKLNLEKLDYIKEKINGNDINIKFYNYKDSLNELKQAKRCGSYHELVNPIMEVNIDNLDKCNLISIIFQDVISYIRDKKLTTIL